MNFLRYSYLRAVPSGRCLSTSRRKSRARTSGSRRMGIEEDLRRRHQDLQADTPHFTTLVDPGGQGVVTIPMPDGDSQCLPVFSTPVPRCRLQGGAPRCRPACAVPCHQRPRQLSGLASRCARGRASTAVTLDRCPQVLDLHGHGHPFSQHSCRSTCSVGHPQGQLRLARLELYLAYALKSARIGRM